MATLFERITGVNLIEGAGRIPVSAVIGMLREYRRGEATDQQIFDEFNLTTSQQTDLTTLYTKVIQSTDPEDSLNIVEDWLSLAEVSRRLEYDGGAMATEYQSAANFSTRLNNLG